MIEEPGKRQAKGLKTQDTPFTTSPSIVPEQEDAVVKPSEGPRDNMRGALRPSEERHTLRGPEEYPMDNVQGTKFHIERPLKPGENPSYPNGRKGDYPEGFDLQWVGINVWGQHQPSIEADFTRKGWQPVYNGDFGNRYRGRFIPHHEEGIIEVDGLRLVARPMSWSEQARKQARGEASNQVQIKVNQLKSGELEGVMGSQDKSALNFNHVKVHTETVSRSGE